MSKCTAGFTARKGNQYGIITAGHCMGTMIMNGYRLESINGGKSPTADARFDAIPTGQEHRVLDDFICGNDTLTVCDVFGTRTRSQMAGAFICHTGVKSGYSCGTVTAIDYRPNNAIACFEEDDLEEDDSLQCDDVFVRVEGRTLRGCRGDSGGPWFQGARALGIHSGGNDPDNCGDHADGKKWLYFSAIHEVEDYLELSILTQGSVTVN